MADRKDCFEALLQRPSRRKFGITRKSVSSEGALMSTGLLHGLKFPFSLLQIHLSFRRHILHYSTCQCVSSLGNTGKTKKFASNYVWMRTGDEYSPKWSDTIEHPLASQSLCFALHLVLGGCDKTHMTWCNKTTKQTESREFNRTCCRESPTLAHILRALCRFGGELTS